MVWHRPDNAEQRFWKNVKVTDDCWIWLGHRVKQGYGRFRGRRPADGSMAPKIMAHRFAYELFHGPVPDGLVLDHLCRNTSCVNPAHLEPVEHRTNVMRGLINGAMQRATCSNGHEYDEQNMRRDARGYRVCRACQREHQRAARKRKST